MFFTPRIILFFYTIPLTKAVSLKIDGLIDLGPNWSYEYRINSPKDTEQQDIGRSRHVPHHQYPGEDKPHNRNDPKEDERMRKDEEKLRKAEDRLRKEAAALRKAARHDKKRDHGHKSESKESHKHHKDVAHSKEHKHHSEKHKDSKVDKHEGDRHSSIHDEPRKSERDRDIKRDSVIPMKSIEGRDISEEIIWTKTTQKQVTFSSNSDESSSLFDSEDATTPKQGTMFDMYDFTTTRKPRRPQKTSSELMKKQKEKFGIDYEIPLPMELKQSKHTNSNIKRHHGNKTAKMDIIIPLKGKNMTIATTVPVTNATIPTTTAVTTVRTDNLYSDPHKVKDDAKIIEFTNHLYKQTLKVFDVVKQKTSQYHVKKQVDSLAKSYEDKFKEFLRDTSSQKIKTRLGTQKVILNTIEMSNRILKRLINFMIGDMDKKGVLRHNVATANIFQQEVEREQNLELGHACKKFGICHTGAGFPEFLTEIITVLLRCDDRKFKQSIDALTEVVKNTNYNKALDAYTEEKLKNNIDRVERFSIVRLRPMFMIIKNIITNRNKPLVVNNVNAKRRVNATLAFLEILDLLDQKMPRNESNALEWLDITNSFRDYSEGKRYDVQEIMEVIVKHMKKTLKSLDKASQKIVCKNINVIIG